MRLFNVSNHLSSLVGSKRRIAPIFIGAPSLKYVGAVFPGSLVVCSPGVLVGAAVVGLGSDSGLLVRPRVDANLDVW